MSCICTISGVFSSSDPISNRFTMTITQQEFEARATRIKWMLFDVDGVLTSHIHYGPKGEVLKSFDPKDGFAIKAASSVGIRVGALSGRSSPALECRLKDLGFHASILGRNDKLTALDEFLEQAAIEADELAYIGDDLPDLPVLNRAGLAFAPSNAAREVKESVDRVLESAGGDGAVREMIEIILRLRGDWQTVVARHDV